jgi:hypothetical protein
VSLHVLMVLSTYPFALLLPTVIFICLIPNTSTNYPKSAAHSLPLSVLIHLGLPHLATILL